MSARRVGLFRDVASPYCHVAATRLDVLAARTSARVEWRSFLLRAYTRRPMAARLRIDWPGRRGAAGGSGNASHQGSAGHEHAQGIAAWRVRRAGPVLRRASVLGQRPAGPRRGTPDRRIRAMKRSWDDGGIGTAGARVAARDTCAGGTRPGDRAGRGGKCVIDRDEDTTT